MSMGPRSAGVSRGVSRRKSGRGKTTPPLTPITWETARCEATATGWRFVMPEPVSTNRLWRRGRTRAGRAVTVKSQRAAMDQEAAAWLFSRCAPLGGDVALRALWVRSRRSGDVDNRLKAMLDALKGVAYGDDAQVARLTIERTDEFPAAPGLYVLVEPAGASLAHTFF